MAENENKSTDKDKVEGVSSNGRIIYVEPNDLYGKPNPDGMPLTPDYADFCISVQLLDLYQKLATKSLHISFGILISS